MVVVVVVVVVVLNVVAVPVFTVAVAQTHALVLHKKLFTACTSRVKSLKRRGRSHQAIAHCSKELQFHIVTLHQRTII